MHADRPIEPAAASPARALPRRAVAMDSRDNVANALEPLEAGDRIDVFGRPVAACTAVPLGHKVAIRNIPAGAAVVKYGQPIGRARSDIEEGEHVHAHNVASLFTDWLSSQTGQADRS